MPLLGKPNNRLLGSRCLQLAHTPPVLLGDLQRDAVALGDGVEARFESRYFSFRVLLKPKMCLYTICTYIIYIKHTHIYIHIYIVMCVYVYIYMYVNII